MKKPFPFPSKLLLLLLLLLSPLLSECNPVVQMTIKGGTGPACAACKYQRRRCSSECVLAPYFPAEQPKMFQNAHRLFGVSKITEILKQLRDDQKEEAMRSIIYESNIREQFPVHGCWGIICLLRYQLRQAMDELKFVKTQIAICKDQVENQIDLAPSDYASSSQLQLGLRTANTAPAFFQQHPAMPLAQNYFLVDGNNDVYVETNDDAFKSYYNNININNSLAIQSELVASQAEENKVFQDYDDIQFDGTTMAEVRKSYIESKEICEPRSESSLKDTTQSIAHGSTKNKLKRAAACLSLTSVK